MGQLNRVVRTQPIPAGVHTKQLAHGIAELMSVPLRVACTPLLDRRRQRLGRPPPAKSRKHDPHTL